MSEDKVKLPRSSYEELCKIIKAYGRLSAPASLDEVSHLCAMNKTGISANNAFLANIQLIEGGQLKAATAKGKNLAQSLEHELPDQIAGGWACVVRDNEFLSKMAAAVKIRGKMDSSALESHIAYSAGEAKSSQVMTGARAVVDILRAAGVVREQDGQLVASEISGSSQGSGEGSYLPEVPLQPLAAVTQVAVPATIVPTRGTSLHIELRIDAKPSELDGLGRRICKLLQELSGEREPGSNTEPEAS
jgi:hypothetical protein